MTTGRAAAPGDEWVERVRAASDIAEVIGQTVALKRQGRNWVGLCPFHGEKTPSFSVNGERQFYHCFGCKAGGDVFKFVQETEKVGFLEAVELLSRRAGIPVPERRPGERGQRTGLLDALEAAAAAYEQWLGDPQAGGAARAYLERRGITRDSQRAFRLGLAPAGWDHLAGRLRGRFSEDVLVQAGLVARRDNGRGVYDRFRDRLMVPLVATGGAVVGFGARALGDDPPKYLNSPETAVYRKGSFLFALEQARRALSPEGEGILVEGYFDAIALHQAGLTNVVATSGTALTPDHARILRRLTGRVVLTFDGDAAGQEATLRSLGVLLAEGLDPFVVDLPPGEDPDTFIRAHGLEGWQRVRAEAHDPASFVQRHMARGTGSRDAREQGLQTMVRLAAGVTDPIRLRLLLERAAETFGVGIGVLARAIHVHRGKGPASAVLPAEVARQRDRERSIESRLLTAVLFAPDALPDVMQWSQPEDFRDPDCRALATRMWEGTDPLAAGDEVTMLARELQATGGPGLDWAAEARGAARRMHERRLREALQDRRNRLSHAAAGDETTRLMQEIDDLARSLREWTA
jgi:DNA primase